MSLQTKTRKRLSSWLRRLAQRLDPQVAWHYSTRTDLPLSTFTDTTAFPAAYNVTISYKEGH